MKRIICIKHPSFYDLDLSNPGDSAAKMYLESAKGSRQAIIAMSQWADECYLIDETNRIYSDAEKLKELNERREFERLRDKFDIQSSWISESSALSCDPHKFSYRNKKTDESFYSSKSMLLSFDIHDEYIRQLEIENSTKASK